MKRSINILFTFMLALLVTSGMNVQAQSESVNESKSVSISTGEDGKVTLKVTTKQGNDSKTFEKTYDSYEEMTEDPELEEYGISADDLGFGGKGFRFGSPNSNVRISKSPNFSIFFDDDEDDDDPKTWSHSFNYNFDSLSNQIDKFRSSTPFFFHFGPGGKSMDMDSLMSNFGFNGKGFFFGADDFMDMDSLREQMMDKFKDMDFDFDFDGDEEDGRWTHSFQFGNDDDDNPRIISRVKVFVRTARDSDKEKVGSDEMEDLTINDISFYPNPSDGRFELELDTGNELPVYIKIVGPQGDVVYEKNGVSADGFYDYSIDISNQREGIYILQVVQNGRALTKRIIIE